MEIFFLFADQVKKQKLAKWFIILQYYVYTNTRSMLYQLHNNPVDGLNKLILQKRLEF